MDRGDGHVDGQLDRVVGPGNALRALHLLRELGQATLEVVRIAEEPVHHFHRTYGTSQFFNFRRLFRTGRDLMLLWYALVVRREHLRANVTPLAKRAADPTNRVYPSPPHP